MRIIYSPIHPGHGIAPPSVSRASGKASAMASRFMARGTTSGGTAATDANFPESAGLA
jgi:hypothetical protein